MILSDGFDLLVRAVMPSREGCVGNAPAPAKTTDPSRSSAKPAKMPTSSRPSKSTDAPRKDEKPHRDIENRRSVKRRTESARKGYTTWHDPERPPQKKWKVWKELNEG